MDFQAINYTPFPALSFLALNRDRKLFHVNVLRITAKIMGGSLQFDPEQEPLVLTDEYFGEMNKSSIKQESDLAPFKPKCDVIVNASAYAPRGVPVRMIKAGIKIMAPEGKAVAAKFLNVNGPRFWDMSSGTPKLTESEPIFSLPITYEYAYGGENIIASDSPEAEKIPEKFRLSPEERQDHPAGPYEAPIAHSVCETNPLGSGYYEPWYIEARGEKLLKAPQIESPEDPITDFNKTCPTQGLGVIAKPWEPRLKLGGSCDDEYIKSDKPLPADFDFAYWNCAHPDLQVPYLSGDEEITLTNLCPHNAPGTTKDKAGNTILKFTLAGWKPFFLVHYEDGKLVPAKPYLDTVVVEPEENKVSLVYRNVLPVEPAVRFFETRLT